MLETLKKLEISSYIQHKHLLVDTNFIFESAKSPHVYKPVINYFIEAKATLVTIPLVTAEFLKGTHDRTTYLVKTNFFNRMIAAVLPMDTTITEHVLNSVIPSYGNLSAKADITDLFLAGTLMRYSQGSLVLLTANHRDFPTSVFDRLVSVPIDDGTEINTFSLYTAKNKPAKRSQKAENHF